MTPAACRFVPAHLRPPRIITNPEQLALLDLARQSHRAARWNAHAFARARRQEIEAVNYVASFASWHFRHPSRPCVVCQRPSAAADPDGRVRHPRCAIEEGP